MELQRLRAEYRALLGENIARAKSLLYDVRSRSINPRIHTYDNELKARERELAELRKSLGDLDR